ncbi:MAG: hypothetical protein IPN49_18735 [Saprospiraceae bacterium]|nr:hypothetical protein [Saprospiraceae bacterium]
MAISKVDPTIMYAAGGPSFWVGGGQVFRSSNTGQTWTQTTTGLPANINYVTDIAADPVDANYAFLTIGGFINGVKVFQTSNAGVSWTNITFNLPNVVVNSITVTYNKIYVGTDISVYSMDFGGILVDIGDNIPHAPVIDIAVDEDRGIITAATFGRGIWQRLYCVNDIFFVRLIKGKLEYESFNQIISNALIPGINNIDSIFMTSGKVILQPGFRAKEGSYMKAAIGTCNNGSQPLSRKQNKMETLNALKKKDE